MKIRYKDIIEKQKFEKMFYMIQKIMNYKTDNIKLNNKIKNLFELMSNVYKEVKKDKRC